MTRVRRDTHLPYYTENPRKNLHLLGKVVISKDFFIHCSERKMADNVDVDDPTLGSNKLDPENFIPISEPDPKKLDGPIRIWAARPECRPLL